MNDNRQILTVSQLNRAAKDLLETYLPLLWIEGELSNLSAPSSGHWYFSLKDASAQVRCAMFKGRNALVRFRPEAGRKVLVRAKVSLYEGRGDFQLIVEHMEPAGQGDLQRQFELLKEKLQSEGLFLPDHKKPLPAWPQRLGVITSPTGAAIHDILNVLKRRFPALPILVLPVAVQGAEAAGQIVEAIQRANNEKLCDVLIVGRGGGSIEDLWAFNEEPVARAIFASHIPIVSAVGHEVDFTIADFVADVRAPTPSAAAEMISQDGAALARILKEYESRLTRNARENLRIHQTRLKNLRARLQHPKQILQRQSQTLDYLDVRLAKAIQKQLAQFQHRLERSDTRLQSHNPAKKLLQKKQTLAFLQTRLIQGQKRLLERARNRLGTTSGLLHSVSPLNTLSRGYAIVITAEGKAVRQVSEVSVGERVVAKLAQGQLVCEVQSKVDEIT